MDGAGTAPPVMPGQAEPTMSGSPAADGATARMGPNAITRLAQAMDRLHGQQVTRRLFDEAGQSHHLVEPPGAMVDECDVIALHRTGRSQLGLAAFAQVFYIPLARPVFRRGGFSLLFLATGFLT